MAEAAPIAVYLLCALTSLACAVMLMRGYRRSRGRFLLWSGLCFVALALNNILLFVDKVIYADTDPLYMAGVTMGVWRGLLSVGGLSALLYGLIWDAE